MLRVYFLRYGSTIPVVIETPGCHCFFGFFLPSNPPSALLAGVFCSALLAEPLAIPDIETECEERRHGKRCAPKRLGLARF